MPIIDFLIIYAFSFVGLPYKYGGNNPVDGSGFDCSGYVTEILKASGLVRFDADYSAQHLYDIFTTPNLGKKIKEPQPGALSFYGHDGVIDHVGFVVNEKMMLEAGGGDETTLTKEDAMLRGAFVKLRPIYYRKDFVAIVLPNYQ